MKVGVPLTTATESGGVRRMGEREWMGLGVCSPTSEQLLTLQNVWGVHSAPPASFLTPTSAAGMHPYAIDFGLLDALNRHGCTIALNLAATATQTAATSTNASEPSTTTPSSPASAPPNAPASKRSPNRGEHSRTPPPPRPIDDPRGVPDSHRERQRLLTTGDRTHATPGEETRAAVDFVASTRQ
ncbi:MAG: hypothetical protein ACI8XM_000015 [Haloarculaceae archaeon]|jgi:hypothetical protein